MTNLIAKLHARLGDFWWYALLIFAAQRTGDLINAFVGLWLVPKYVSPTELGAVLPLTQFATLFGMPIAILVVFFTKYLAEFKARGEDGKVKSLLHWFIGGALILSALIVAFSPLVMPKIFERLNVKSGSLATLILAVGISTTIAPVFGNALQGLKKFKTITFLGIISAPIRLVTMLVTMPIRALSGYMCGQLAPTLFGIFAAIFALRKDLRNKVSSVPFWQGRTKEMLWFLSIYTIMSIAANFQGTVQTMIIRQRLPEVESAAYYMISRFSDLALFAGTTLAYVLFPLAAEAKAKGKENVSLLVKTLLGTFICGVLCAIGLYIFGEAVFNSIQTCHPYSAYITDMALLAVTGALGVCSGTISNYEVACGRFNYNIICLPISIGQGIFLIAFTGYTFFSGTLPETILAWIASLHIATLRNIIWVMLVGNVLKLVCAGVLLTRRHSI